MLLFICVHVTDMRSVPVPKEHWAAPVRSTGCGMSLYQDQHYCTCMALCVRTNATHLHPEKWPRNTPFAQESRCFASGFDGGIWMPQEPNTPAVLVSGTGCWDSSEVVGSFTPLPVSPAVWSIRGVQGGASNVGGFLQWDGVLQCRRDSCKTRGGLSVQGGILQWGRWPCIVRGS